MSAVARHLGHNRKTIRVYLSGGRVAGQRAPAAGATDPLGAFVDCLRQRLADDPHVWAVVLFDEAVRLGFDRSYPTFTKSLRAHRLRPHCELRIQQWTRPECPPLPGRSGQVRRKLVGCLEHLARCKHATVWDPQLGCR